jgi:trans-aconitate methyltransferase
MKAIFTPLASQGLNAAGTQPAAQLIGAMVEGSFFWMVINTWIWQTLIMGSYGKYKFTEKQPWAGFWYMLVAWFFGIVGFIVLIGFIGLWWKPFNLAVMFTPKTAADVALAYEGWEASNFFALAVIVAQIPFASLLHKWPFAGTSKQPTEGLGALAFSTGVTYLFWLALIVPSFLHLSLGEHEITSQPFGSWPAFVAFCQAFVIFAIMPAEGCENYPMKLFAKKQPYMAIIGFIIALAAGFLIPPALGIDASRGMIATARKLETKNLSFRVQDINDLDFKDEFDVIFSNATLHWIQDHKLLLSRIYQSLKENGIFRVNFGAAGNCVNFIRIVNEAMKLPEYAEYFRGFKQPWYFPEIEKYEKLVRQFPFSEVRVWAENADRYFPDADSMIKWINQPSLVPFLEVIPADKKQVFRDYVVGKMITATRQEDGRCFETFRRINVWARL